MTVGWANDSIDFWFSDRLTDGYRPQTLPITAFHKIVYPDDT